MMHARDRISKLEARVSAGTRLTGQEIDTYAAEFDSKLRADGAGDGTAAAELAGWREMVEGSRDAAVQRIIAASGPADLRL